MYPWCCKKYLTDITEDKPSDNPTNSDSVEDFVFIVCLLHSANIVPLPNVKFGTV
jgi:hypothetical protein